MRKIISNIIASSLGLWLATLLIPQVRIEANSSSNFFGIYTSQQWQFIIALGIILGLINYILRSALKSLDLPVEIASLFLLTIIVNIILIWMIDAMFKEIYIPFFLPILYTTLIILGLNIIIGLLIKKR